MSLLLDAEQTAEAVPDPAAPRARAARSTVAFAALSLTLVVVTLTSLSVGSITVPVADTLRIITGGSGSDPRWDFIVMDLRLPRTLTALIVGAALGVAGLQMQTLFRNALADPYILGASSGASLGVALVVMSAGTAGGFTAGLATMGRAGIVVAAALGAGLVLALILVLARWVKSAVTLLLIGVMIGSATTAAVSVLLVYGDPQRTQQFLLWGMGSFTATTWSDLTFLAGAVAVGLVIATSSVRALNALLIGEGYARSMGINLRIARLAMLLSSAVLAGVTTAFCGPVGFLGLVVPHLARMTFATSDHRVLLPGVVLLGASVAAMCGLASQLPGTDTVLPLNAVTALVGAPVVIAVLVRSRRGALGAAL